MEMEPEEVLAKVLPDRPFFRSHGGVTLTGGEPLEQPDFALALAALLRRENIHVAMETCGFASPDAFRAVLPHISLFLYDWKITDPGLHRHWTGEDNRLILQNLQLLHDSGAEIILRCPVIPGVNDTAENLDAFAGFVSSVNPLTPIELLPYHKTAGAKYEMIGMEYKPIFQTDTKVSTHPEIFEKYGLEATVL